MRSPKVGTLVRVEWLDASRQAHWTFDAPSTQVTRCESVGWVGALTVEAVTLVPHRAKDSDGEFQHFGDMTIPRRCVTLMEVLRG